MYEKDYLMRYFLLFLEKIAFFLSKRNYTETDINTITNFYDELFQKTKTELLHKNKNELIFGQNEKYHLEKMRLLAELFYLETKLCSQDQIKDILNKSLFLFEYVDQNNDTFDFGLQIKIDMINKQLNEI